MPFVVLPNRQKFYTNAKFIQKLAGFACILSGDNISQSEYPERPQCNISKIADRQPDDVKRAVLAVIADLDNGFLSAGGPTSGGRRCAA